MRTSWFYLAALIALAVTTISPTFAYSPEAELLKIKGFSPESIKTMETQRSRQEWKAPPSGTMTTKERFFHNIYYNNWIGSVDEFGSYVIRERQ